MRKDKYSGLQEFRVSRVSRPRRVSDPNHADLEIRFRPISNKKILAIRYKLANEWHVWIVQ